jgi:DNA-binding NtrC family response regulator
MWDGKPTRAMSKILVVEDDRDLRALLADEIGNDVDVLFAESGSQGIAMIGELPDLAAVVSDLRLGAGPDGFEVLRAAATRHPTCSRVLVTGDRIITLDHETSPLVEVVFRKPWVPGTLRSYLTERLR